MSFNAGSRSSVAAVIGALLVMAIVRKRRWPDADLRRDRRAVEKDDAMTHWETSVLRTPELATTSQALRAAVRLRRNFVVISRMGRRLML
jgi:hypothetical protein